MFLFPNRNLFEIPLIINSGKSGESIWTIYEEADTGLIFHERISNKAVVIVAKDTDAFLPLIYVLEQLECFLLPWFMAIDPNHSIKIKIIYSS